MTSTTMTSLQRVLTTLGHKEPDRVPLFLLPNPHGAKELGLSIREYFARGKLTVLGNLNGVEIRHWNPAKAENAVRKAIFQAGPGGGFILSDNHGEIPWQVPDEVPFAIAEATRRWGVYPLQEVESHGR